MMRPRKLERSITAVFGQSGSGKTQWTRRYLRSKPRIIIYDPMGEYDGPEFTNIERLLDYVVEKPTFRARWGDPERFPDLCKIAYIVGNLTLVIEEAQRIIPPQEKLPEEFTDIIYRGRHKKVSVVTISQRAATTSIAVRSQWSRLISFRQSEPDDIRWLSKATGRKMDAAQSLPRFHFFDVTTDSFSERKLLFDNDPELVHSGKQDEH